MENASINPSIAVSKYIKESLQVSYLAQEASMALDKTVREQLEQELLQNISLAERPDTPVQEAPVRHKEGTLNVEDQTCGWCMSWGRYRSSKCILHGSVLKIGKEPNAKYYCFDATPFQLTKYKSSFKLWLEGRSDVTLYFSCESAEELESWYTLLQQTVTESKAHRFNITAMVDDQYWLIKKEFILEQDFCKRCETGDILLFKGKHIAGGMTRFATSSQYDHVGVVVKDIDGRIRIFESTSQRGVSTFLWADNLIKYRWYECIDKIVWRHLNVKRTPEFMEAFNWFLQRQMNKAFGFNIVEILLIHQSKIPAWRAESPLLELQDEPLPKEHEKYFCSKLVAHLYKTLGLIDPVKSCNNYWPKDFSEAGQLPILKGGSLENQRVIVFDRQLLEEEYRFFD